MGDDKNIRKETKEKVIEAAKRLGYRPNPVAINLKYGHTNTCLLYTSHGNHQYDTSYHNPFDRKGLRIAGNKQTYQ